MKIISRSKEESYQKGDIIRFKDAKHTNYGMIVELLKAGNPSYLLAVLGDDPSRPSWDGTLTADGCTTACTDEGIASIEQLIKNVRAYGSVVNKIKLYGVEE